MADDEPPNPDRDAPVGESVGRGNPESARAHTDRARRFDPDDPETQRDAAEAVGRFAETLLASLVRDRVSR